MLVASSGPTLSIVTENSTVSPKVTADLSTVVVMDRSTKEVVVNANETNLPSLSVVCPTFVKIPVAVSIVTKEPPSSLSGSAPVPP